MTKPSESIFLAALVFLVVVPCCTEDEGEGTASDTDTDTDSDSDPIETDECPFEINCSDGQLFEYGPAVAYDYYAQGDELVLYYHYTYEYESDTLMTSTVTDYTSGKPLVYDRNLTYNASDLLERIEWSYDSYYGLLEEWRTFEYDASGRLTDISAEFENTYETGIYYTQSIIYDDGGRMVEFQTAYPDGNGSESRWAYEYDGVGRLTTQIWLEAYDGWEPSDNYYEFSYDETNRLTQVESFSDAQSNWVETYVYYGDGGQVLTSERSDGSQKRIFQWEGFTLTVTYSNANGNYYREVYDYGEEGDSAYYGGVNPLPAYQWVISLYGQGYLNGCAGF